MVWMELNWVQWLKAHKPAQAVLVKILIEGQRGAVILVIQQAPGVFLERLRDFDLFGVKQDFSLPPETLCSLGGIDRWELRVPGITAAQDRLPKQGTFQTNRRVVNNHKFRLPDQVI